MSDDPHRSFVAESIVSLRRSAPRIAAGMALVAAASIAGLGALSRSDASPEPPATGAGAAVRAEAPVATDASMLSMFGLPPSFDAETAHDLRAVVEFVDVASRPAPTATATATVAPPTPVPPTPRPIVPTATTRVQQPPPPPAPTATPQPAPPPAGPWGLDASPMDAYSQALFNATNARRVANGLPALRVNGWLIGIARIRSADMARNNYFAHTSPVTGDTAFSLMDTHAVPYAWGGENLAKNNYPDGETVAVAEDALWNSPPHRENTLNTHYTDMGIALVVAPDGMKYFTLVFTGP